MAASRPSSPLAAPTLPLNGDQRQHLPRRPDDASFGEYFGDVHAPTQDWSGWPCNKLLAHMIRTQEAMPTRADSETSSKYSELLGTISARRPLRIKWTPPRGGSSDWLVVRTRLIYSESYGAYILNTMSTLHRMPVQSSCPSPTSLSWCVIFRCARLVVRACHW